MDFSVVVIGTGSDPADPESGYSMGYQHGAGYQRLDNCELVGCSDIDTGNAQRFADRFDIPSNNVYTDHNALLADCNPDVVSVCTPPTVHATIVQDAAVYESVNAIHCEKPMAPTWRECTEMVNHCQSENVKLSFNHQRRFGKPFTRAKDLLNNGSIGALQRIEIGGKNLFDYGTHLFDLCGFYTNQATAEWVLAGIDYRNKNIQYGVHNENQAIAQWQYENGVVGIASTGRGGFMDCQVRIIGSEGVIEIGVENGPPLRVQASDDNSWRVIETDGDGVHDHREGYREAAVRRLEESLPLISRGTVSTPMYTDRAIEAVVRAVEDNRDSQLKARNALEATELIFASWESARRRGRVTLPLEIEDNPLVSMVESGEITPT